MCWGPHGVCISPWPELSSLEWVGWVDLCLVTTGHCSLGTVGKGQSWSLGAQRKPRERLVFEGAVVLRGGHGWYPLPGCHVCFLQHPLVGPEAPSWQ